MYSISQAVEEIINTRPYLSELIEQDLLNVTQLARQIELEVEDRCMKEISTEAIAMAIRRLPKVPSSSRLTKLFAKSPDIMVRSHLCEVTVKKQDNLKKIHKLLDGLTASEEHFFTITQGIFEDTIIVSKDYVDQLRSLFKKGDIVAVFDDLAAVTIRLDPSNVEIPGVYYYILKSLLMENVNVVEVVSTYLECTILVAEKDAEQTFASVKKLFKSP